MNVFVCVYLLFVALKIYLIVAGVGLGFDDVLLLHRTERLVHSHEVIEVFSSCFALLFTLDVNIHIVLLDQNLHHLSAVLWGSVVRFSTPFPCKGPWFGP